MKHPLIIAHRGASALAPENTLAAFRRAIADGADGIELDVRLAKDGVLVVVHDATLKRTTGSRHRVGDLTSAELADLDAGSWFDRRSPVRVDPAFSRERVPTLVQTLELVRDFPGLIFVELKSDSRSYIDSLAGEVGELIMASPLLLRTIVTSFDLELLRQIRSAVPQVKTGAIFAPSVMRFFRRDKRLIDAVLESGADHLLLHQLLATRKLIENASETGLPVTVWTVDDPRWLRAGIYAVITNDPLKMLTQRNEIRDQKVA